MAQAHAPAMAAAAETFVLGPPGSCDGFLRRLTRDVFPQTKLSLAPALFAMAAPPNGQPSGRPYALLHAVLAGLGQGPLALPAGPATVARLAEVIKAAQPKTKSHVERHAGIIEMMLPAASELARLCFQAECYLLFLASYDPNQPEPIDLPDYVRPERTEEGEGEEAKKQEEKEEEASVTELPLPPVERRLNDLEKLMRRIAAGCNSTNTGTTTGGGVRSTFHPGQTGLGGARTGGTGSYDREEFESSLPAQQQAAMAAARELSAFLAGAYNVPGLGAPCADLLKSIAFEPGNKFFPFARPKPTDTAETIRKNKLAPRHLAHPADFVLWATDVIEQCFAMGTPAEHISAFNRFVNTAIRLWRTFEWPWSAVAHAIIYTLADYCSSARPSSSSIAEPDPAKFGYLNESHEARYKGLAKNVAMSWKAVDMLNRDDIFCCTKGCTAAVPFSEVVCITCREREVARARSHSGGGSGGRGGGKWRKQPHRSHGPGHGTGGAGHGGSMGPAPAPASN